MNVIFKKLLALDSHLLSKMIEKMPGDASAREYYRVHLNKKSYVVMKVEPFEKIKKDLPFLAVQEHLRQSGVRVPRVLDVDFKHGFILLEDLGNRTLLRKLQEVDSKKQERQLYEGVLDLLVQLHVQASINKKNQKKLDAFKMRFDYEKLMWEVSFAVEHLYKVYLKRKIPPKDKKIIQDGFHEICSIIDQQPVVFTHRDFHSRNLMFISRLRGKQFHKKAKEECVTIDFQDARMGPVQYDLASLLRDSYYQLEESQVVSLVHYYIKKYECATHQKIDLSDFMVLFDLVSIQRNFKAIGSFASFMNQRGNPAYLKYIGNTFENIRKTLLKYPYYSKLRETLFYYYYF